MLVLARILSILPILTISIAQDSPFLEPVEVSHNVEYYDDGQIRFAIYTTPVTWKEALRLCPSKGGNLLEFDNEEISAFIGRALAESVISYGSLWIGGQYTRPSQPGGEGKWSWIVSTETIDAKLDGVNEFPMTKMPFWVDRPNITTSTPLCLATARKMHDLALILGQPCDKRRPYICQLPGMGDNNTSTVEVKPPIYVRNKKFHLFMSAVTWSEALSQCHMLGMELATLVDRREFNMIGNRMMRSRPIMENAWIGGIFYNDVWTWVSSNTAINVDKAKETSDSPFVWYRPDNIIMDGCLLADRHVCDHFVYVEAKCSRRRSFICEEETEEREPEPLVPVIDVPNWWVSTYEENWYRAQNVCKTCLDGELIQLGNSKEGMAKLLPQLFSAMAITVKKEIRHVWVGAHLFKDKFKWTYAKDLDPVGDEYTVKEDVFKQISTGGEKGTIAYCNANFEEETYLLAFKCLNLDRENQKNFFLYGLLCVMKQHFVCQAAEGHKLAKSCLNQGLKDPAPESRHGSYARMPIDSQPQPEAPHPAAPHPEAPHPQAPHPAAPPPAAPHPTETLTTPPMESQPDTEAPPAENEEIPSPSEAPASDMPPPTMGSPDVPEPAPAE